MRLAEGNAFFAHERVGDLGDGDAAFVDVAAGAHLIDFDRRHEGVEQHECAVQRVECLEAGGLHLAFAVVHVGERRVVQGKQDCVRAAGRERAHEAQMLDRHGVALLRHD